MQVSWLLWVVQILPLPLRLLLLRPQLLPAPVVLLASLSMVSVVARVGREAQPAQVGPVNTPVDGTRSVCRLARAMIPDDEGGLSRPVLIRLCIYP